jgi:hypothetical protein
MNVYLDPETLAVVSVILASASLVYARWNAADGKYQSRSKLIEEFERWNVEEVDSEYYRITEPVPSVRERDDLLYPIVKFIFGFQGWYLLTFGIEPRDSGTSVSMDVENMKRRMDEFDGRQMHVNSSQNGELTVQVAFEATEPEEVFSKWNMFLHVLDENISASRIIPSTHSRPDKLTFPEPPDTRPILYAQIERRD